jgi:pimeloyl-ACP methyl ester carboxylesterase
MEQRASWVAHNHKNGVRVRPIITTFLCVFCVYISPVFSDDQPSWLDNKVIATVGSVDFRDCELSSSEYSRYAQCAFIDVPENYALPDGKTISLFIARFPTHNKSAPKDSVLAIAGGPGQSASEAFIYLDKVLHKAASDRDFYLIDQRGTGRSNIQTCEFNPDVQYQVAYDLNLAQELLEECFKNLSGDPTQYTTSVAIKDFERARQALAVSQWNLYGGSYGTRVEQHYMRKYPNSIRTAVLDSVVPPQLNLGPEIPLRSQDALNALFERCEQDEVCNEKFPDLRDGTYSLFEQLKKRNELATPMTIQVESIRKGHIEELSYDFHKLLMHVRMSLYHPDTVAILPPLLHQAYADNNFAPLARNASELEELMQHMFATAMHNSVVCTEDVPFYDWAEIEQTNYSDTYMGGEFIEIFKLICDIWPPGVIDDGFKEPLQSSIPTLVFSGEFDPITPPAYGELIMPGLKSAKHFVLSGQAHGVSTTGCAPTMIAKLIDENSVNNLDGACLKRVKASPIFTNFNGPSP